MIIEIFIAEDQPEDPLAQKLLEGVLDVIRIPMVLETLRQSLDETDVLFELPEQKDAGVGSDGSAVEFGAVPSDRRI